MATREENSVELTHAGKTFTPATDIFETDRALTVVMDMPGVAKDQVTVRLENDLLEVEGRVAPPELGGRQALYSEYNVGHFYRRFHVSNKIARDAIVARLDDGVLTLELPKAAEAQPRRIPVN